MIGAKKKLLPINIVSLFPGFSGAWCLVDYVPRKPDPFSISLIRYKRGERSIVNKWNSLAVERLKTLNIHFDYILRALGSKELDTNTSKPLDELGRMMANAVAGEYLPALISKKGLVRPLHSLQLMQRKTELREIYRAVPLIPRNGRYNILILDDIVTTGATMEAIRRVLRNAFPVANLYFFTLARTAGKFSKRSTPGKI